MVKNRTGTPSSAERFECGRSNHDLYGLPVDTPGLTTASADPDPYHKADEVRCQVEGRLGDPRFRLYLQIHEFEPLLFTAPAEIAARAGISRLEEEIASIAKKAGGPEQVDNGPATAPSKRLAALWPGFSKAIDGPPLTALVGLQVLRTECPYFGSWLAWLEGLSE